MSKLRLTLTRPLIYGLSCISLGAAILAYSGSHLMSPGHTSNISTVKGTAKFPNPTTDIPKTAAPGEQVVVFAGGCFWGMEAVFEHVTGVIDVVTGYAGDSAATAHYEQVSSGQTQQAESVKITYDPSAISYGQLLKLYFAVAHDPTQLNRQGPDSGPQYRSAIFFANDEQRRVAQTYIEQLNNARVFSQAITTRLEPLNGFYAAEEYHQNFIDRNPNYPYVVINDLPKLERLRQQFPDLYKN
jgi:peptide-methionine (S)-S-oxide reductase